MINQPDSPNNFSPAHINTVILIADPRIGRISPETESTSLVDRKMGWLKRVGLFGEDTKGATIRRACTADDLLRAYRLVHSVFLGTGYLKPEPAGLRLRIFETTSETATFIAEKEGEVVGVLSVVGDSKDVGLPSDAAFKPELDGLRAGGLRLCELTNQAVGEAYRKSAVSTELMRCAVAHMLHAGFHEAVATVSPSHQGFYEMMGFRQTGSERSYSLKLHDPVIALRMDLGLFRRSPDGLQGAARFIHDFATNLNPYLAQMGGWGKLARRQFLNADLLEQLFVQDRNFLAECTPVELKILQRRWGQEMFQAVTGLPDLVGRESAPAVAAPVEVERSPGPASLCQDRSFLPFSPWRKVMLGIDLGLLALAAAVSDRLPSLFTVAGAADEDAGDGAGQQSAPAH